MQREILFRGQRIKYKHWVVGYLIRSSDKAWIALNYHDFHFEVTPETLGQYTGLEDKTSKKIFEGDIVKYSVRCYDFENDQRDSWEEDRITTVIFKGGAFIADGSNFGWEGENLIYLEESEVIGNIWENPELLSTQSPYTEK